MRERDEREVRVCAHARTGMSACRHVRQPHAHVRQTSQCSLPLSEFPDFHSAAQRSGAGVFGWLGWAGLTVWHGVPQRLSGTCGKGVDEGAERELEIGKGVAVDLQQ